MIVYSLLAVTVILATLSLCLALQVHRLPLSLAWHRVALSFSLAFFVYLDGAWLFLSVYVKFLFAACYLLLLLVAFVAKKTTAYKRPRRVGSLVLCALLAALDILYFTGTAPKPHGVSNLSFPFRHGRYIVFQGGKGLPTNLFHYSLRTAVYAMDLVKLNNMGNRANSIFSTQLNDYATYGDTIYSPCAGTVLRTRSDNPDNIPPHRDRGPSNTNQVLIATDSFYVFLGHMQHNKVFVQEGGHVVTGQPLGLAGNSGFSLEPHLHIQVQARTNPALPWYREPPMQIAFDGKTYLLFQEIQAP